MGDGQDTLGLVSRTDLTFAVARIKVLLVYIVYPFAIASYFRKALENREDVDLRVAGPYTGNWIPWLGGMTVSAKYARPPDFPLPFPPNVGEINYEIIKAQLGDWRPDIVLNIDAGLHFRYRPSDGYVVTVATDPHVLQYDVPRGYSDKFFNMQLYYSKPGDIYLPYAYSRYDHYPVDSIEKSVDAVLIGMPYAERQQWVSELRRRGVSVILENGPIFDEARELYARGRIGLNWSSMQDLNARVFELAAMRLCPVVNSVPDIQHHPCLSHHLVFGDLHEAVERVVWAKENPDSAREIAEMSYNAVQGQTYDGRVETILKESGFL